MSKDSPLKILFVTVGDETIASSRTRVYQYLPHLNHRNVRTRVVCTTAMHGKTAIFIMYLKILVLSLFSNILFIQKVLLLPSFISLLQLLRRTIVFDFDDAIYTAHQTCTGEPTEVERLRVHKFETVVKASKLIVAENSFNCDAISSLNTNVLAIIGPIDTSRYSPSQKSEGDKVPVIGWIGSPVNTLYLHPILPALERLFRTHRFTLTLIGAADLGPISFPVLYLPWSLDSEIEGLKTFDIGIMPLPDDIWSRGKGGYKLLQYMALGIPSVASPVGVNCDLLTDGVTGFLAEGVGSWHDNLALLLASPEMRMAQGAEARKVAVETYSFEVATPKLITALTQVA